MSITIQIPLLYLYWVGFLPCLIPLRYIRRTFLVIFPTYILIVTWMIVGKTYLGQ